MSIFQPEVVSVWNEVDGVRTHGTHKEVAVQGGKVLLAGVVVVVPSAQFAVKAADDLVTAAPGTVSNSWISFDPAHSPDPAIVCVSDQDDSPASDFVAGSIPIALVTVQPIPVAGVIHNVSLVDVRQDLVLSLS